MPTDIEQTIYKLSLDGSDYVAGVDQLSASTSKLSAAQEAANKKLNQLKETSRLTKEEIKAYTKALKDNEQQLSAATAKLNLLNSLSKQNKEAVAAATKEVEKYAAVQSTLKNKISESNIALNNNTKEISNQNKVLKESEKATAGFVGGLKQAHAGLSKIANLIPGLGFAGLVGLVAGPLVNAFTEWYDSVNKTSNALKLTNGVIEAASKEYSSAVENVSRLRSEIALAKDGFLDKKKVVEDYNTSIGKTTGLVKNLDEAEKELNKNAEAYIKFTFLKAVANEANAQAAKKSVEAEIAKTKRESEFVDQSDAVLSTLKNFVLNPFNTVDESIANSAENLVKTAEKAKKKVVDTATEDSKTLTELSKKYLDDAAKLAKAFGFNFFQDTKAGTGAKGANRILNIYEQELQKLRADIAKLDEKGFTNEATITKAVEEDFKKRSLAFDKAFKNKQITGEQLASLNEYLRNLQELTLAQNLKVFRESKAAYLAQIDAELNALQIEENSKRIATIQDRFERERQLILSETEKTVNALKEKRDKQIADITKNAAKNGLTPAEIAPQIEGIKTTYSKLLDDLEVIKNQKLQQLSFDTFEKLTEDAKRLLDSGNLGVSQGSLINIKAQTELFLQGKISYKQYQKELTEIAKFEVNERFRLERLFLQAEIKIRQDKLNADKNLTDEQVKRLEDEIRRLQQQLTDAEKGNITVNTKPDKDPGGRIGTIVKYAQAIGGLISEVVGFWQQANEAETAALDRSIALQQKRVDAAGKIAARGNAEYLKAEEDRLKELNIKRENAARKQLAINAALQGSEVLVALISGLAQGAKIGGALGAIASVTAIVAAIAGAYAIVQSLKPPQASFFVGTKDTGRGGREDSKGGFSATIHPHEAITPADKNKAYHPVIEAIHDGTIPAEHLNQFVNTYHKIKSVPQPNYSRIKDAAELKINQDGSMSVLLSEQNKKLDENNSLHRQTLRYLKNMGVNVSLDKNGFALTQMEVIEQIKREKRL